METLEWQGLQGGFGLVRKFGQCCVLSLRNVGIPAFYAIKSTGRGVDGLRVWRQQAVQSIRLQDAGHFDDAFERHLAPVGNPLAVYFDTDGAHEGENDGPFGRGHVLQRV